VRFKELEPF